jgi:hypothetical protein
MQKTSNLKVLRVQSPTQIVVDINNNGVEDDNELLTLKDIESFSLKPNKNQTELVKMLKIQ